MGQQIGQHVCRAVIACSCLLWKQWGSRSSCSAEQMRCNISLGAVPAQAPLALPSWRGQASSEGCFGLWSLFLSGCHLLPWPSMGILLQSAALLHGLVLTGAAMVLVGSGTGQPWKVSLALSVLQEENKQHRKNQSVA